jgi:formiminoglutamase
MADLVPHGVPALATAEDDPRLGHWLVDQRDASRAEVVIVGFPSDEGVRRNGGRPGAAAGPRAIREALYRMTPDARAAEPFIDLLARTADLGDLRVTGDVDADQARLADIISPLLQSKTVIVLGGGHETTFGHFLGYAEAGMDVDILNWDAHADVRPLAKGRAHSGSPFFQALTHPSGHCGRYHAAGLQPHATATAHVDLVRQRGGEVVWCDHVDRQRVDRLAASLREPALVTFDLDAVDAAAAPGVSAPNPAGLSTEVWLHAAFRAGASGAVRSMDVVELNPAFDVDGRTARLAALTVWHFVRGLCHRPGITVAGT